MFQKRNFNWPIRNGFWTNYGVCSNIVQKRSNYFRYKIRRLNRKRRTTALVSLSERCKLNRHYTSIATLQIMSLNNSPEHSFLWRHMSQRHCRCTLQSFRYCSVLSGNRWVSWCQLGAASAGLMTSLTGVMAGRGPGSGVYVNVSPVAYMMPSLRTRETGTWRWKW